MPIINSFFLPPSPLLIPDIGKENSKILNKTSAAYQEVALLLKQAEIETIIIISAQNPFPSDKISLNIAPVLKIDFKELGHISDNKSFNTALSLASSIQEEIGSKRSIRLVSSEKLDYASAIPLHILDLPPKVIKVLPIYTSLTLDRQAHYEAGVKIKEILQNRTEKIAIIATGSLSNRLKKSSPHGYSPKSSRFDHKTIEYLNNAEESSLKILNIEEQIAQEVQDKSLRQLALLLGIIGNNYQNKLLAYQNDFGIGYLSMYFDLQVAQI